MLEAPVIAKNKLLSLHFLAFIHEASGACSYNENILCFSQCMYLAPENNLLISWFSELSLSFFSARNYTLIEGFKSLQFLFCILILKLKSNLLTP